MMLPTPKAASDTDKYTEFVGILRGVEDDEINCKQMQGFLAFNPKSFYSGYYNDCWAPQHLYFVTDDEIKEGDWKYNTQMNCITQHQREGKGLPTELLTAASWCRKIVATTNLTLQLPTPSNTFLKEYCDKGGIDEVAIEIMYFDALPHKSQEFEELWDKKCDQICICTPINN